MDDSCVAPYLPSEILALIIGSVENVEDVLRLRLVSRFFHRVARDIRVLSLDSQPSDSVSYQLVASLPRLSRVWAFISYVCVSDRSKKLAEYKKKYGWYSPTSFFLDKIASWDRGQGTCDLTEVREVCERVPGPLFFRVRYSGYEETPFSIVQLMILRHTLFPGNSTAFEVVNDRVSGAERWFRVGWFPETDSRVRERIGSVLGKHWSYHANLPNLLVLDPIFFDSPTLPKPLNERHDEEMTDLLQRLPFQSLSLRPSIVWQTPRKRRGENVYPVFLPLLLRNTYHTLTGKGTPHLSRASQSAPFLPPRTLEPQSLTLWYRGGWIETLQVLGPCFSRLVLEESKNLNRILWTWHRVCERFSEGDLGHVHVEGLQVPIEDLQHLHLFPASSTLSLVFPALPTPTPKIDRIYQQVPFSALQLWEHKMYERCIQAHPIPPNFTTILFLSERQGCVVVRDSDHL